MFKIFTIVVLTVWISTVYGNLIIEKLKINNFKYTAPLGFASILFILQITYYPIQLFNLPSYWIHISTLSVYLIGILLSLKYLKATFKQLLYKSNLILIVYILMFIFVLNKVAIDISYADGQMYLNYITQNISINNLNKFNLWTGLVGSEFVTVYLFQGYYHFAGSFILFVNSFSTYLNIGSNIDNIVIIIWGLGSLYAIISGLLIVDIAYYLKTKNNYIKYLIIGIALFYTNFYYWKTAFSFYGNTWRSLFMGMMIYYFYRLVSENNYKYKYVVALVFGASLSASSSTLFIGFSILLGIAFYFFKEKNQKTFQDLSIMGIPMVLYVLAVTYKDHKNIFPILLIISILYYSLFKLKYIEKYINYFNAFISKYVNYIFLIIIPSIAIIYSIFDMNIDPQYIWNFKHYFNDHAAYDMVKNYIFLHSNWQDNVLNLLRWTGVFILFKHYRLEKSNKFILRHFLLLSIFFLNPFATTFISKMFASNVYYRVFESFFNVFTEMLLFSILLNHFWNSRLIRRIFTISIIFILGFSHYDSLILMNGSSLYGYYIETGLNVNNLYKLKPLELEVIKEFKDVYDDIEKTDKQITVVSHADGLRTFIPEIYQVFTARQYWSSWDRIDQDFYQVARMWHGWEERPEFIDYSKSCEYLRKYKIDYVINEIWLNYEFNLSIEGCTSVLYENYEYKLRKVNY